MSTELWKVKWKVKSHFKTEKDKRRKQKIKKKRGKKNDKISYLEERNSKKNRIDMYTNGNNITRENK